jgi:hypothetical protein
VCWCQMTPPGRRRAWGEWPGKTKDSFTNSTNVPALKKAPVLGAQKEGKRHLTTRLACSRSFFFREMGKTRGERVGALAPGPTMPVPLIKARGQQRKMTENKNHCLAATPECGEWPGAKPCRMIPFLITPGGWVGRVLDLHHF